MGCFLLRPPLLLLLHGSFWLLELPGPFSLPGAWALRSAATQSEDEALVDQVNVLAGTQNIEGGFSHGNTLPILARPFGFNHWAVQTRGQEGSSWWFSPEDTSFVGLRCTHQPSPWIGDYGHFLVYPAVQGGNAGSLRYDVRQSTLRPYLLKTALRAGGGGSVTFQAVPTMHGAAFLLAAASQSSLNFRLPAGSWSQRQNASGVLGGGVPDGDREETLFVAISCDDAAAVWTIHDGLATVALASGGLAVVRLATSFISAAQAEQSLAAELAGRSWSQLLSEGKSEWEQLLRRVEVTFPDPGRSRVFYSNLYRGLLFPRFLWEQDAEGKLVHRSPFTKEVLPGHAVTDEGFWDAYRTHYPMLALLFPDILGVVIDGWVNAYLERGWLPTWASYTQRRSMVGTMGDCSLADAVVKSAQGFLSGFDGAKAFEAIYKDATTEPAEFDLEGEFGRVALKDYREKGYVPSDHPDVRRFAGEQSAALTLNYNLADACIALAAEALGKADDAKMLRDRSRSFRRIFDNQTKYFRPMKTNGDWDRDLNPIAWGNGFTEAAAAQYRFEAPQDVLGLSELMGGREAFCQKVHELFESSPDFDVGSYNTVIHEMEEAKVLGSSFGLYAHNNQPVHAVLYIAIQGGCGSFARKTLRQVMSQLYTVDGWSGDEDTGEMSSWYVLSALGLYSLVPGSDELVLGSPEVLTARLKVPGRPALEIKAPSNSDKNVYVKSAALNQHPLESVVQYSKLVQEGGELRFEMSDIPTDSL